MLVCGSCFFAHSSKMEVTEEMLSLGDVLRFTGFDELAPFDGEFNPDTEVIVAKAIDDVKSIKQRSQQSGVVVHLHNDWEHQGLPTTNIQPIEPRQQDETSVQVNFYAPNEYILNESATIDEASLKENSVWRGGTVERSTQGNPLKAPTRVTKRKGKAKDKAKGVQAYITNTSAWNNIDMSSIGERHQDSGFVEYSDHGQSSLRHA